MKKNLTHIAYLVIFTWIVFGLSTIFNLNQFGIVPRTASGLIGIIAAPFLHGGLYHILSNTMAFIPFIIIFSILEGKSTFDKMLFIILIGGFLTWVFARSAIHIGASGLIFGLYGYLVSLGFFKKNLISIVVSIFMVFSYGYMILGVLPSISPIGRSISWEGHLFGFLAGILLAKIESSPKMKALE